VTVERNDDMRKIAAWAGIAAVWTAVAGIYWMNFRYIPELQWHYGYLGGRLVCLIASLVLQRSSAVAAGGCTAQPSVLLRPEAIGSIIGSGSPAKPCPWVSYSSHAIRLRRRDAIAPATPATAPAASSPTSMPSRRRPDFDSFFMITFVMARLARRLVAAPRVGAMTASGAIADTLVPHRRAAPKDGDIAHSGIIAPRRMAARRAISACRDIERHAGPAASPRPPAA
jgi:hypothetical protein